MSQGGCQTLVARLMTDGRTLGRQMDRSLTCVVPRCTGLTADAASLYCDYNTTWAEQQAASLDQSYFIMWEVAFVMVPIRVRCPPHSSIVGRSKLFCKMTCFYCWLAVVWFYDSATGVRYHDEAR